MRALVEAVRSGQMDRRTFFAAVGLVGFAGAMIRTEFARAVEVKADFKSLNYLVHPDVERVSIDRGTFWDVREEDERDAVRHLKLQILIDNANRNTSAAGLDVPIIFPTDHRGPHVNLQGRVFSQLEAVKRFGKEGTWSGKLEAWRINEFGQAFMLPNPNGNLTTIRPNGAVVDTVYPSKDGLQGVILRPEISEYQVWGASFWLFGTQTDNGVAQIIRGQMQRGFSPYVMYGLLGRGKAVGLERRYSTKQELVDTFGVPGTRSATFNLPNGDPVWDIAANGGVVLWPAPDGSRTPVRPNGAIIEVKGT